MWARAGGSCKKRYMAYPSQTESSPSHTRDHRNIPAGAAWARHSTKAQHCPTTLLMEAARDQQGWRSSETAPAIRHNHRCDKRTTPRQETATQDKAGQEAETSLPIPLPACPAGCRVVLHHRTRSQGLSNRPWAPDTSYSRSEQDGWCVHTTWHAYSVKP
jgi:hypothetical protein